MRRECLSRNWAALSPGFKRFLVPAGAFALVYLSLGFMLLRAHDLGFGVTQIVLYARFNHQRGDIVVAFAVYDLFYAIDEAQRERPLSPTLSLSAASASSEFIGGPQGGIRDRPDTGGQRVIDVNPTGAAGN